MSSHGTDLYTKDDFYDKLKDRTEVSRFRVHVTESKPDKSATEDKKTDTHRTFEPYKRRPRHHQVILSENMEARHKVAAWEFCDALTNANYSTSTTPNGPSTTVVKASKDFKSKGSLFGRKCYLWASEMTEHPDTGELEFKVVVSDAR